MIYNMLYDEFLNYFPEDAAVLKNNAVKLSVEPSDGMHIIFGMIVDPFLMKLVKEKNEEKLKTIFAFFEQMARSKDTLICEVLEFTVLEDIISEGKDTLDYCRAFMGKETLASCQAVEKYMM